MATGSAKKVPLSEKQKEQLAKKEEKLSSDIAGLEDKIAKKKEEITDLTAKLAEKKKEHKVVSKSLSK